MKFLLLIVFCVIFMKIPFAENTFLYGNVTSYDKDDDEVSLAGVKFFVSEPADINSSFISTELGKFKIWLPYAPVSGRKIKLDILNDEKSESKWKILFPYKSTIIYSDDTNRDSIKVVVVPAASHKLKSENEMMSILKDIMSREALQLASQDNGFLNWYQLIEEVAKNRNLPAGQLINDLNQYTTDVLGGSQPYSKDLLEMAKHSRKNFSEINRGLILREGNRGSMDNFETFLDFGVEAKNRLEFDSAISYFGTALGYIANSRDCEEILSEKIEIKNINSYMLEKYKRAVSHCEKWIAVQEELANTYFRFSKIDSRNKVKHLVDSVERYEVVVYFHKILSSP